MDEKDKVSVPFVLEHMSASNRRMFHSLLAVCITFILTIVIFVVGYTIREKNWLTTITNLEVQNGVHQQSNPGAD